MTMRLQRFAAVLLLGVVSGEKKGDREAAARRAFAERQVVALGELADAEALRALFAAGARGGRHGACSPFADAEAAEAARAPLVIGGQGGSGTRSVVSLLRAAGVEMNGGVDGGEVGVVDGVNTHDSLAMRSSGLNDVGGGERGVLAVLAAASAGGLLYDLAAVPGRAGEVAGACAFALNMSAAAARAAETRSPWGWKEPRSLFHLPALSLAFPKLRFVHVARDVRSLGSTHVEGDLRVWRRWWSRGDALGDVLATHAAVVDGLLSPWAPRSTCDGVLRDALLWRSVFGAFWAEEQLALIAAGERLGGDRYFLARVEDLSRDAAVRGEFLGWALGAGYAVEWDVLHDAASYRYDDGAARVCDLLVHAALTTPRDVRASPLALPKKCPLLDFLNHTGALPAARRTRSPRGLLVPAAPRGAHRTRAAARLRVVAAVKARCWALGDAPDGLHDASPAVRAALAALGYPAAAEQRPRVYGGGAAGTTAAQEVYANVRVDVCDDDA